MRHKIIFLLVLYLTIQANGQVCPNETNINNTNVCGIYGDGSGNSSWNWEISDPSNPNYCLNWYARTSPTGNLNRIGSPFVNANTGKLKMIADEGDYTKAKGWELLQRKFGCQTDVANPYFVLYNRYTGMLRVYVYITAQLTLQYSQILMTIKSVYDIRPATISDARDYILGPDKYYNNLSGTASEDVVISLNQSVGSNNWAVAEFYMMLDENITIAAYQNASLEVMIYGVTANQLSATIHGTSSGSPVQDGAFKTKNATTGGSTFNFTAQGEKLIKFSKSIDDFIKGINDNATKVYDATKANSGGLLKDIADGAKFVKDNTGTKADFSKIFAGISSFLGAGGQLLKFAGTLIGIFNSSSGGAASPSYTYYNLEVTGTITAQVVVNSFVIKIPGSLPAATNSNNATYFNYPMGIFNLKTTPVLDTLTYNRRALLPQSFTPAPKIPSTVKYVAYRLHNNVEAVLNYGTGLSLVSAEGALLAKVVVDPANIRTLRTASFGPLDDYPINGYYTYFNHMRADLEAHRLEMTNYDADAGTYHTIQTPFYPLECLNRASMNIHLPVMKIFLRIRAILRRTDGQGDNIYYVKDYELDKQPGDPAAIPADISTNLDAIPPYANYTVPPNTSSVTNPVDGSTSGVRQDIRIACNNCPGYQGTTTFPSAMEMKANHTISTSTNYFTDTYSDNYTVINSPGQVTFRAGSYVLFRPKFLATYGSVFLGTVDWGNITVPCYATRLITNYVYNGNAYNSNIFSARTIKSPNIESNRVASGQGSVYPNPASNKVYVETGINEKVYKLEVFDASGRSVSVTFMNNGNGQLIIDITTLENGSYFAKVTTKKGNKNYKFVVLRR